jgi:hypothetical protein
MANSGHVLTRRIIAARMVTVNTNMPSAVGQHPRALLRRSGSMSSTRSVSPSTHPSTRELRALALYRTRRDEIKEVAPNLYRVPSCTGERAYTVDYGLERCSCPDHALRGANCKHILVVGILVAKRRARTAPCAGCGERFRRRDMVEVLEDHESLTFFAGDLVCEGCAGDHGIL